MIYYFEEALAVLAIAAPLFFVTIVWILAYLRFDTREDRFWLILVTAIGAILLWIIGHANLALS